jgi:small ligand-binding sensory domain FIST
MRSPDSVVDVYNGNWNEGDIAQWARALRAQLSAPVVSLGIVFVSPALAPHAVDLLEVLRLHARIPLLVGCSAEVGFAGADEHPLSTGFILALHHLPGALLHAFHLPQNVIAEGLESARCRELAHSPTARSGGFIAFADPFQTHNEAWLAAWNGAFPGVPTVGGLAGDIGGNVSQVYLNGAVHDDGVVLVGFTGEIGILPMVSQGCTPIGEPWTITRAERNFILGIANRPAYSVLVDTFNGLPEDERKRAHNNLMVGFASSEDRDEHRPGDFLVRNLLGVDPRAGALAVGTHPRTGQTLQFQRRDADSAAADLARALELTRTQLRGRKPLGGVLFACCGRGEPFFGHPGHDALAIQEQVGPLPIAGLSAQGEIGPVGATSHLHGYTASLALFVRI